jgi:hypothetical protein
MSLNAGFAKDCTASRVGGVKEVHIASADDVTSFTGSAGDYTAVVMESLKVFVKFEFEQDVAEWRENGEGVKGAKQFTHETEIVLPALSIVQRNAIQDLADQACGMVVIVTLANGVSFVQGYSEAFTTERPAYFLSDTTTSGQAILDPDQSTVVLQSIDADKAFAYTGVIPV